MIHILIVILKWIGIVIAAILGILALLLCVVLFQAVHYQARVSYWGERESLRAGGNVSWLFGFLKFEFKAEGQEYHWKVRVFWKKFLGGTKKEEERPDECETKEESVEPEQEKKELEQETPVNKEEKMGAEHFSENLTEKRARTEKIKKNLSKKKKSKKSFQERFLKWKEKIAYTFQNMCDKIKVLNQRKEMVLKFISYETHKKAWEKGKKELFWLLKKMKPDRIKSSILFGFSDPYHTGQALAVLSMIYPFMGEEVEITPDFENRILRGSLYVKGKIRLLWFVKVCWKLFWCKDVRITYKHIRHIEKKLGGKENGGKQ